MQLPEGRWAKLSGIGKNQLWGDAFGNSKDFKNIMGYAFKDAGLGGRKVPVREIGLVMCLSQMAAFWFRAKLDGLALTSWFQALFKVLYKGTAAP